MTSNRIRWEDIDSQTYEDMVAVLINRIHPACRRIDGSGGDGGRDVHLPLPDGLEIFELKGFTGRLNDSRRRQVKRSLERAAAHNPRAWHLVVPINHTPSEEEWFERLAATKSFHCDWLGKTWLESQLAGRTDIIRHFLESASDEVVRLLTELRQEQAALAGGVPDALERLHKLTSRVNELDPYYGFVLTSHPDGNVSVSAVPKYTGAQDDRPVRISGTFHFAEDDEAASAFTEALYYGTPVTLSGEHINQLLIDAPGMPPELQDIDRLSIGPAATNENLPDARFDLRLYESERLVSQLPLVLTARSVGIRGVILTLIDDSGSITVTLKVDPVDRRLNLNYKFSQPGRCLPSQLIPPTHFLGCMRSETSMAVAVEGQDVGPPVALHRAPNDDISDFLELLKALDKIQRATGCYFPLPYGLTAEDLANIDIVVRLLDGETVSQPWDEMRFTTTVGFMNELRSGPLGSPHGAEMDSEVVLSFTIAGNEVPLGRARRRLKCAVHEWPSTERNADPSEQVEVTVRPAFENSLRLRLIDLHEPTYEG